jgi:flagellar assembly protein FliH
LSRLLKGDSVNLGDGRFVYRPQASSFDPTLREHRSKEEPHERRARELMREAESYADQTRAQAHRQSEEIRAQARREGYDEGYHQGRSQADAECGEACVQIDQLLKSLDAGRQELFRRHEQELMTLAVEIARKVIYERLERDDETFVRIFRKAVEGLSGQRFVRLRLSWREYEFATAHADYLRSMIHDAEKLEIRLDESAPPGTLVVDTEESRIDASADRQLEIIGQALAGANVPGDEEEDAN